MVNPHPTPPPPQALPFLLLPPLLLAQKPKMGMMFSVPPVLWATSMLLMHSGLFPSAEISSLRPHPHTALSLPASFPEQTYSHMRGPEPPGCLRTRPLFPSPTETAISGPPLRFAGRRLFCLTLSSEHVEDPPVLPSPPSSLSALSLASHHVECLSKHFLLGPLLSPCPSPQCFTFSSSKCTVCLLRELQSDAFLLLHLVPRRFFPKALEEAQVS